MNTLYKMILYREHEVKAVQKPGCTKVEGATLGTLSLYRGLQRIFECKTVENAGESTNVPNQDKRILPGFYTFTQAKTGVKLPKSAEGKGILLVNPFDPTFINRRIFIHIGNYPQDSEGCILLNMDVNYKQGFGVSSTSACQLFYNIMKGVQLYNASLLIVEKVYSLILGREDVSNFTKGRILKG